MRPAFKPQVNVNIGENDEVLEAEGDEMINKFLS
jgi:hypothetical protein